MSRHEVRWILPVLALLCITQAGEGQGIRVFNTENGLPHNRVNRIYVDSRGFLWVCTDDGLSRFNGHQFVNYTTANGIPHKYVNAVLETRSGEFWVASDGGISRFDPRPGQARFTTYAPSGPEDARHVNALLEDVDGSILLGTSFGLYRFKPSGRPAMFEHVEVGRSADRKGAVMVNALARDAHGALWLATNKGLYYRGSADWERYGGENDPKQALSSGIQSDLFVNSFADEGNGRLWAAFKDGFGRLVTAPKPGTPVFDFVQTGHPGFKGGVRSLWFGRDARRWIASESGFWEWVTDSTGQARFRQLTIYDEFPRETFISLREDGAGNLWIGTRRSGLVQLGSSRFETFTIREGLRLGSEQLLLEERSGRVSVFDVAGRRAVVYRWGGGGQPYNAIQPDLPELGASGSHTAIEDRQGAWWVSTLFGLFRLPSLAGRADLCLLPESEVKQFFEDSAGDLWISHWPRGGEIAKLARWERRTGRVHDETQRLPPDARTGISAFAQDHTGQLWISLPRPDGRLLRIENGRFQPLSERWSGHINRIFVDSKGRVWATSTESGLALIEMPQSADPKMRRYTRAHGLAADEVWCVTEDRLGRIYAGTAKGVDRLDPGTDRVVHFSVADGLVRGDIRSALRDRDGNLWFVSAHGVSRFEPGEDPAAAPAPTRITGFRMAGVPLPLSEFGETEIGPVRVSSHQNSLQVDFAATDFRTQAPPRYQFRLDRRGRTDQAEAWQDPGTTSTVHLVDLVPGDFTFQVRTLTPDGSSGEPASIKFSILEPFWRALWFQLACAIAIAGLAYWMRTRRLQQQLAIERVRSHIAMDLHDDIGAGLSRISVIGEALKGRLRDGDGDVQRMLDDIAGSSRQLVADMGDIVWSLDPRRDRIGDLVSRLRAFGSDLLEMRGVAWTVDGPAESLHRNLSPALKRQFYLVFREGIHNAAKHSGAGRVTLRLWLQDGSLWGELTDDGCGRTPGSTPGAGIPSMRERVKQLGGVLEIDTPPGGGTSIRIQVPL